MALSKSLKEKIESLSYDDRDRMIRIAWEARHPLNGVATRFGLKHDEFIEFMKNELIPDAFQCWKKRINQLSQYAKN